MTGLDLPNLGAWCIVDLIEPDGRTTRLDLIHPEPRKQELLRELALHWSPRPGDPFGAPAVSADAPAPVVIAHDVDEALEAAAHTPDNLSLLREIGVGAILTVPLLERDDKLLGALTFMSARRDRAYSEDDVRLAVALADRSADALCSAKLYGDALALRERAVAASEERIRLLGTISHELRTPLNAIGGYADILDEEINGPLSEKQRAAVGRIRQNTKHLLVLIHDVLEFVRTGNVPTEKIVALSAREAVQRAIELLGGTSRKVSVRMSDEPDAALRGDPDKVHQILINLLGNAFKFTPTGGEITTSWEVKGERVRIHVADNGPGVPADKLDAIFEPFVRLGGDEGALGSAGMGLSISHDLARAMGGELTIESVLGEGSRFTLSLPRAPGASAG
jgi:signal transduction histidine kinase